ncbi:MazG-like nucleotide pyrophosphohydrolase [Mycobacterium phage Phrappuccino]|uniref:MazG-like nucleotide pyrophosphohydrolase n=1 Tax=Mycobacterium phage Phrappuccino TaxID=2591223 RepID=A0A514DDY9_9CAUD|nr:MazG-like pyrophosphatase [Mycobacterium phage Phrappuccino]QDH91822.1 MazG-like nucleotide pyrophosphohydrolase [Mycobacterium phage Phrappuccino]QIQ63264.1 MazG-like nucleotide pyrophosphohydrolase [Mycobacterium phage Settecandela]
MSAPNLLDATETFMWKAGQLDAAPLSDHWGDARFADQHDQRRAMRVRLIREEIEEYLDAEDEDDLVEIVDGLLDIIVVAWGTLLDYVGPRAALRAASEVVRTNLAKVLGPGLPLKRADGKVLKPEGWTPPDIAKAIGWVTRAHS